MSQFYDNSLQTALMRDLDHALTLIDAVVGAVSVPVTLKMRLGWDDDCLNAPDLARRASNAGVRMLTVHGRTRAQFYKGQADWAAIDKRIMGDAPIVPLIYAKQSFLHGSGVGNFFIPSFPAYPDYMTLTLSR